MTRRLCASVVVLFLLLATTALLLTDRAPVVYEQAVDRGLQVAADIRDAVGLDDQDIGRQDVPVSDKTIGHTVLFASATVVAGFVFRRRFRPVVVGAAVFAVSAVYEVAQPVLSWSREQSLTDLVANGVGVVAGVVAVSLLLRIPRLRRSRSLAW